MGGKQKENEAYGKAGARDPGLWREVAEVGSKQRNYLGLFTERDSPAREDGLCLGHSKGPAY